MELFKNGTADVLQQVAIFLEVTGFALVVLEVFIPRGHVHWNMPSKAFKIPRKPREHLGRSANVSGSRRIMIRSIGTPSSDSSRERRLL